MCRIHHETTSEVEFTTHVRREAMSPLLKLRHYEMRIRSLHCSLHKVGIVLHTVSLPRHEIRRALYLLEQDQASLKPLLPTRSEIGVCRNMERSAL